MREIENHNLTRRFAARPKAFGLWRLVAALLAWPTCWPSSPALSGAKQHQNQPLASKSLASPHSTATSRLRKALTSQRTPKRRSANIPARLLVRLRRCWRACIQAATRGNIHFQKYRVAPRLGTDTVRRRLLFRLDQNAPLAATETGLA